MFFHISSIVLFYGTGTAVLVKAMRLNVMEELCSGDSAKSVAGVCWLEADKREERMGGGRLQDYRINSNTFADSFFTSVLQQKLAQLPPESVAGTELACLAHSNAGTKLERYGSRVAPLDEIGTFLCEVGAAARRGVLKYPATSACHCGVRVARIQLVECFALPESYPSIKSSLAGSTSPGKRARESLLRCNSWTMNSSSSWTTISNLEAANAISTTAMSQPAAVPAAATISASTSTSTPTVTSTEDATIATAITTEAKPATEVSIATATAPTQAPKEVAKKHSQLWKVTYSSSSGAETHTYATHVVLATGGRQTLPDLGRKELNDKLLCSDDVVSAQGIQRVHKSVLACSRARIVIIGGSHSAFSAAWMLLNRLDADALAMLTQSSICMLHAEMQRNFGSVFGAAPRIACVS
jgi:hypothetical protein